MPHTGDMATTTDIIQAFEHRDAFVNAFVERKMYRSLLETGLIAEQGRQAFAGCFPAEAQIIADAVAKAGH